MTNSLYIGLSQQMALRNQMDGIANNVANMNTTGFKGEQILFQEYLVPTDDGIDYSYVVDFGISRNHTDGVLNETGNTFDLAIRGEGFFVVETPEGQSYTRNGHFQLDESGTLVTVAGEPVLSDSGRQLSFNPEDGRIKFSPDGSITSEFGSLGSISLALVTFEDLQRLNKTEHGLYETDQDPEQPLDSSIHQGMIENSNVNSIVEMTRMIDVTRKYELIQRLIDAGYDLERSTIQRLGQVQ